MTELEELLQKKKEIEQQIKLLTKKVYTSDGAKMFREHWGAKPDPWTVSLKVQSDEMYLARQPALWRAIIRRETKDDAISDIDNIILELKSLKEKILND